MTSTTKLYRPVGQGELDLIAPSGFKSFPPRLPKQPIFYPVLTKECAEQIARDWNTKDERSGFVGMSWSSMLKVNILSVSRSEKQEAASTWNTGYPLGNWKNSTGISTEKFASS